MSDLEIRRAVAADVPVIVAMLADDPLGAAREGDPADPAYAMAFAEIDADPHQLLAVATRGGEVVGTLQLTFIPGLSRRGMRRALIEAVRVRGDQRGQGTGRRLVEWAIDTARARGCGLVQLTTDRSRADAHRFYEGLGFAGSHLGMKLAL
ncbi:GNAT family N-acetyltransferase [Catellatospora sp. NPDC049609]|uniref:GNAT family N-acetyltransferase n=1 Tax=Catellatospora sp. NPDC049609 TaxID=3155505 RepID=UPI003434FFC0